MKCVICNGRTEKVFSVEKYEVVQCIDCTHRMLNIDYLELDIENIYSDVYFFGGKGGYPNYFEEEDILTEGGRYYAKKLGKYMERPGSVLDVGAAAGFILKGLTEFGWEGYGVELNDMMARYARDQFGLKVETSSIESFRTDRQFNVICFIQIIAHLSNPNKVIQTSMNMLSEGGFILIETWNYRSLTARLFGKCWHEYSPPSVLHWFSRDSLNRMMGQFAFELIASGHPKKYLSWNHAKTVMSGRLDNHALFRALKMLFSLVPDNIRVPYPAEDLLWFLFKRT